MIQEEGASNLVPAHINENTINTIEQIEKKIPSYIGVSCAISGYRALNKYDAAIREGLRAENSPTRIALPRGPDGKILHVFCDVPRNVSQNFKKELTEDQSGNIKEFNYLDNYRYLEQLDSTKESLIKEKSINSLRNMNGHSSSSLHCTTHYVQVQKLSTTKTEYRSFKRESQSQIVTNRPDENSSSTKSFIEQRIERLYGPGALGMAFRTRRAILEREIEGHQEQNNVEGNENTQGLPSVFRHLRPEFRHQLPVKTKPNIGVFNKINNNNECDKFNKSNGSHNIDIMNGHTVRHIPKQLEEKHSVNIPVSANYLDITSKQIDEPDKKLNTNLIEINNKSAEKLKKEDSLVDKSLNGSTNVSLVTNNEKENRKDLPKSDIKDGHYFLKVVDSEIKTLLPRVKRIEEELDALDESLSEEVKGKLLAATGKTKLLIDQKVEQFKGLCHKNIIKSPEEEFPTTDEDLAGFWDMVSIQVDHIKQLLKEVDELRENNWQEVSKKSISVNKTPKAAAATRKTKITISAEKAAKDAEKVKANEERRKAMREALNAKRKAAANKSNNSEADQVEIFVPNK